MATTPGIWVGIPADMRSLAGDIGASLVGYDDTTLQAIADSSRPIANYAVLRAFKGRATGVQITDIATGGLFQRDDTDTTSVDNGSTVIVDGSGRRWKRLAFGIASAVVPTFNAIQGDPTSNNALAAALSSKLTAPLTGGSPFTYLRGDGVWAPINISGGTTPTNPTTPVDPAAYDYAASVAAITASGQNMRTKTAQLQS